MFADVDLRALAEMTSPDRSFLTVVISRPSLVDRLPSRFARLRRSLEKGGKGGQENRDIKDEREHFDQNTSLLLRYLEKTPLTSGGLVVYVCWALDYFQAVPVAAPVAAPLEDLVWIDSSPYIRPLAQLQDDMENVAVLVADNSRARIYLVSSAVAKDEEKVVGNVKNHVRKGGWSQQRYERRRDGALLHYAKDIADALKRLDDSASFRRLLMVGSRETLAAIAERLPSQIRGKQIGQKAIDLSKGDTHLEEEIWTLFREEEVRSEKALWERIRAEYLRGGLAAEGIEDVIAAALEGRVEECVVERDFKPMGIRCRACDRLGLDAAVVCPGCGSESVFPVDLVNELEELLQKTGARMDYTAPISTLREVGGVAALLRYR